MPRINVYTAPVSQGPDQSLANISTQANRSAAESRIRGMKALGEGIGAFAQGALSYAEAEDKIKTNLEIQRAKNAAERFAIEANDYAQTNPDAERDGSSLTTDFDDAYNDSIDEYTKDLSPEMRERAVAVFEDQRNRYQEKLFAQRREKFGQFVAQASDNIKEEMGLSAFQTPDDFEDIHFRMNRMYDSMRENGLLNDAQVLDVKKRAAEDIAIQSIQGNIKKRQFDVAMKRVESGDVSGFLSSDNRMKLINIIEQKKMQSINQDLQMESLENSKKEGLVKQNQEANFQKILSGISAKTDPVQSEAIQNNIIQMRAQNLISDEQFRFLNSVTQDTKGNYNERLEFTFRDKILRTTSGFSQMQDQIVESVNSGGLDAKTGNELIATLKARETSIQSSPEIKQRFDLAEGRINAAFGQDSFFEPLDQPRKIAKQDAIEYMHALIAQGKDPLDAANASVERYGKKINSLPLIPGIDFKLQRDLNGLKSAAQQIKFLLQSGKISKEEAVNRTKILKQRMDAVQQQMETEEFNRAKTNEAGQ